MSTHATVRRPTTADAPAAGRSTGFRRWPRCRSPSGSCSGCCCALFALRAAAARAPAHHHRRAPTSAACCSPSPSTCWWRWASTSSSATPACSTSATSASTRSAPTPSASSARCTATCPFLLLLPLAVAGRHGLGHHPRRPDAAGARRLPGHRDARLRRDRPAHRRQLEWLGGRRGASPTSPRPPSIELFEIPHLDWDGFVADRRPRRHDDVPQVRRPRPDPVLLARRSRSIFIVLFADSPRQGQPRRPRLGGHPRGRGRRRADGRADVQVQAARVRDRRVHRRPLRRPLRQPPEPSSTPSRSRCCSRSSSSPPSSSAARATGWGVIVGAILVAYLPERFRTSRTSACSSSGRADAAGDLPAAGPAAAATHGPGQAGRGGARGARGRRRRHVSETSVPDGPVQRARPGHGRRRCSRSTTSRCGSAAVVALDERELPHQTRARSSA